jgi:hypothetical protein
MSRAAPDSRLSPQPLSAAKHGTHRARVSAAVSAGEWLIGIRTLALLLNAPSVRRALAYEFVVLAR